MIVRGCTLTEARQLTFDQDYIQVEIRCMSKPHVSSQFLVHIVLLHNLEYMVFCY